MKNNMRKDYFTDQFDMIRVPMSLSVGIGAKVGYLDIKGAYLQSGPIIREICQPTSLLGDEARCFMAYQGAVLRHVRAREAVAQGNLVVVVRWCGV